MMKKLIKFHIETTGCALVLTIIIFLFALWLIGCNGDDDSVTDYYSDWQTCIVKEISDGIVTIECEGVERTTRYVDGVAVGDLIQARMDYEVYTEIESHN